MQKQIHIPHIATGDLLRAAVDSRSELGRVAQEYMSRGELVPDSVVIDMIDERLQQNGSDPSFLLDGFPRTVAQAESLEHLLASQHIPLDHVISLQAPREELVRRLSGRRTCRKCGAMYHVNLDPPARPGVCDRCDGELYQRDDDREETIRARLAVYDRSTAPLNSFYQERGLLREVQGTGTTAEVLERILAQLDQKH
jgi:adenylate kinase